MNYKLDKAAIFSGLLALGLGIFAVLGGLGVIPMDTSHDAPLWVVTVAGAMFCIAGIMVFLRNYPRALDFFAALILAGFTTLCSWVALFSSSEGFSGGVPFLPYDTNVVIARVMFGLGGLMCFGGFAYAVSRFLKHPSESEEPTA